MKTREKPAIELAAAEIFREFLTAHVSTAAFSASPWKYEGFEPFDLVPRSEVLTVFFRLNRGLGRQRLRFEKQYAGYPNFAMRRAAWNRAKLIAGLDQPA